MLSEQERSADDRRAMPNTFYSESSFQWCAKGVARKRRQTAPRAVSGVFHRFDQEIPAALY
jgi:hypothetical protein